MGSVMMSIIVIGSGGNLIAILGGLWMCVYSYGGFFNPCITLAFLFKKANKEGITRSDVINDLTAIVFQLGGFFIGGIIIWKLIDVTIQVDINPDKGYARAFFMEVLATFLLILTLMIIVDLNDPLHVGIFSVIVTLYVAISLAGPVSGGCLNPALGVGLNLANAAILGSTKPLEIIWLYILAPLVGAMAGVALSQYLMLNHHHYLSVLQEADKPN